LQDTRTQVVNQLYEIEKSYVENLKIMVEVGRL